MLFKEAVHYIVFADTISADTFSFTSSNDNGKASTDVSLSSGNLEFIQPELAIPVRLLFEAFFQLFTRLFTSIFNISTVVYAINVLFIVLKMFIIPGILYQLLFLLLLYMSPTILHCKNTDICY